MKKLLSCVMAAVLCIGMLMPGVYAYTATTDGSVALSADRTEAKIGDIVTFTVTATPDSRLGLGALDFNVQYNPAQFELVSASDAAYFYLVGFDTAVAGKLQYSGTSLKAATTTGPVVTFQLKVLETNGVVDLVVTSYALGDFDGTDATDSAIANAGSAATVSVACAHANGDTRLTEAPTCVLPGTAVFTCAECGEAVNVEVPATGHTVLEGAWIVSKAPTCQIPGLRTNTCTECAEVITEEIPVVACEAGEWTVTKEATCTEAGTMEKHCIYCNKLMESQEISLKHTVSQWETVKEPTCQEEGTQVGICSDCGETAYRSVPKIDCVSGEWNFTVLPSSTRDGEKVRRCTMCGAVVETQAVPALQGGDFLCTMLPNGTVSITKYIGTDTVVTIPEQIDGYTVTRIGGGPYYYNYGAFQDNTNIEKVIIPDNVTNIGESAFRGCTALASVTIGNGVREICDNAFEHCTALTDLTVGYNVVSIGYSCFSGCSMKRVKGYVGSYAELYFANNYYNDGEKVDFIPIGRCPLVFAYERNSDYWNQDTGDVTVTGIWGTEKNVTVPETFEGLPVTSISSVRNSYLETLVLPSTLQTIENNAFGQYWSGSPDCPKLKSVTIPDGVVSIGESAFAGCPLTSITLPESVQSIGDYAFGRCSALSEIHLPQNLTHIGESAFTATAYSNAAENWDGTYGESGGLYIDKYLVDYGYGYNSDTYKIREGTVLIADHTFDTSLPANLVFPESIHTIGRDLFKNYGTITLSGITFLAADIDINWYAFDHVTLGEIRAYAGSDAQTYAEYKDIPFVDISEIKPNADGTGGTMAPRYGTAAGDVAHTLETVLEDVESVTVLDKDGTEITDLETLCTADMQFAVTFANGKTAIYVFASQTSGDLNGDDKINAVDARWVLQAASGVRELTDAQKAAADLNSDGKINAVDARWILQVASGARTL